MAETEWRDEKLGDLVSFEYGSALRAESRTGLGFRVYGSNGVVGHHDSALVAGPGIIIGRKGSVGALHWSEDDFWPIDTTYWAKPKVDLDLRWIREALGLTGLELLDSSTGVPGLNRYDAYERWISVPPLEEQRRIAEVLDTMDETIRATERVIAKLTVIRDAMQHQLISSSQGEWTTLSSIAVLRGGHGFPDDEQGARSGSLPFYKVSDMNSVGNEQYLGRATNYVEYETAYRYGWRVLPPGSVVFAKVGAALLSNRRRILTVPSIVDNNMMASIPRRSVSTEWLYRWLLTIDFSQFVQIGALPSVNQSLLGRLPLCLPTRDKQEHQVAVLDSFDSRLRTESRRMEKCKMIRSGLADDLLSGRVRTVAS